MLDGNEKLKILLEQYQQAMDEKRKEHLKRYPSDIPNKKCYHAIISGIKTDNSTGYKVKDYTPLLKTKHESLFIWTHTKNKNSSIVSEISLDIKELRYWKNMGYILELASAFYYDFEHTADTNYHWIYYFDNSKSIEENEFQIGDHIGEGTFNGSVQKISFFKVVAPLIELLLRDDKFYTSVSIFRNSVESHWFCFVCELSKSGLIKHPSHEPLLWEEAKIIPKLEAALVQSCRAVEAILGKPGKREDKAKVIKAKERWRSLINLEPDDIYSKKNISYFDYYYELFELRNNSAHSYGELPFSVSRKLTIEAQCFSYLVISAYLENHQMSVEDASKVLELNTKLIEWDPEDFSTIITSED
ncbi:hypothetical protein CU633_17265 [Bacillus sp. V3-13]|uniref:hypothetical protein n=1 Tax=Bacillus sp. V3-13 TaxID=2053728 RepID=UPI000C757D7F|nr:hypothetical protein [Bacillus sp. V3-13]PLR76139.1 hypothetical protein CU633_17265 [Bacillus sp. V3-13]